MMNGQVPQQGLAFGGVGDQTVVGVLLGRSAIAVGLLLGEEAALFALRAVRVVPPGHPPFLPVSQNVVLNPLVACHGRKLIAAGR